MALPAGFDIGFAIADVAITEMLRARLNFGATDPDAPGAIDPRTPPLFQLGYRIVDLTWDPAPDRGPTECWLTMNCQPPGRDLSELYIGLTLTLATDAAGTTTLGVVFRESFNDKGDQFARADIAGLVDRVEADPLLDVTAMLATITTSLGVTLPTNTAVTTGLLVGDGVANEASIGVLVSTAGIANWPTGATSWIHARRHIAVAFGGLFVENSVVPSAIASHLGPLPAMVQPGISVRSLDLIVEPDQLRLDGSAAHDADPGVAVVGFGGPIRPWYSQARGALVVDTGDIDAALPISWLMVLLGPLGIFTAAWIDSMIDAAVRSALHGAVSGLLGGLDPTNLAPNGEPPVGAVMRWITIENRSLVLGLSLYPGPSSARIVAASGRRRLHFVQLDDGDVLPVADVIALIDAGVLEVPDVHVVRSASSGRSWLRADHDASEGNNLRSLPDVDMSLLPVLERAPF